MSVKLENFVKWVVNSLWIRKLKEGFRTICESLISFLTSYWGSMGDFIYNMYPTHFAHAFEMVRPRQLSVGRVVRGH